MYPISRMTVPEFLFPLLYNRCSNNQGFLSIFAIRQPSDCCYLPGHYPSSLPFWISPTTTIDRLWTTLLTVLLTMFLTILLTILTAIWRLIDLPFYSPFYSPFCWSLTISSLIMKWYKNTTLEPLLVNISYQMLSVPMQDHALVIMITFRCLTWQCSCARSQTAWVRPASRRCGRPKIWVDFHSIKKVHEWGVHAMTYWSMFIYID